MAGETARWWSKETVAVVTGANKGIGYEIVKELAKNGITTVLAARDPARGQKAVETLKADGCDTVVFHALKVNDAASVDDFATWLKKEYGGLDILVNNAGVFKFERKSTANFEIQDVDVNYEDAKSTLDVNYYGVKAVTAKLLPLMRPGARIVNMSSLFGQLKFLRNTSLITSLGDEQTLTEELVDSYVTKYLEDVKAGRWKEEGWALEYSQYTESKIFLNAYGRALAKTLTSKDETIFVNNVHPGYIGTDLNANVATGTLDEGADTPVWLCLLPAENYPQGQFFFKRGFFSYH